MSPESPMDKAINSKKRAPTPTITSTQPLEDAASTNVSPILSSQAQEDSTSMTQVFQKKSKQSVRRSMRNVRRNLSEGFEGIKKETDQEINEVREATVEASKEEEELESKRFLVMAYNNLNRRNHREVAIEASKMKEELALKKFYGTAWNNLMNSGKNGEADQVTTDKNGKNEE